MRGENRIVRMDPKGIGRRPDSVHYYDVVPQAGCQNATLMRHSGLIMLLTESIVKLLVDSPSAVDRDQIKAEIKEALEREESELMTERTSTTDAKRESKSDQLGENPISETNPESEGTANTTPSPVSSEFAALSGFQRDLLVLVKGLDTPKGLEIKDELEQYYGEEINHGRLYPNLDTLVDKELVEKIAINKRSNGYVITEFGSAHLSARMKWETQRVDSKGRNARTRSSYFEDTIQEESSNTHNGASSGTQRRGVHTEHDLEEPRTLDDESSGMLGDISSEFDDLDGDEHNTGA